MRAARFVNARHVDSEGKMAGSAAPAYKPQAENARDHLIVALDVPELEEAKALVRQLGDRVTHYKVGPHLFVSGLINFIEELIRGKKSVFLDFKSVDIGDTMRRMSSRVSTLGVEFITVMGTKSTVIAAHEGREGRKFPKILVVTLLTDHDEADMRREYNTELSINDFVAARACVAAEAGADGVISSPKEISAIRLAVRDPNFLIVTPGVRQAGMATDDQKRTATPREAIAAGANYLVVGRPIVKAADKVRAAEMILDEMQGALEAR
jgi:orotidine-5'-phosphate decarboxylase